MPLFTFEGREPAVSPGAWIAPTATLGATVPPGMIIPDGMLAAGVPARVAGEVTGRARQWVETNPAVYRELAGRHAAGARPVP